MGRYEKQAYQAYLEAMRGRWWVIPIPPRRGSRLYYRPDGGGMILMKVLQ